MSDTEDAEGFDKEAEKEKLRAQLEREEENRRSTRHMSELLLKGATMTNKHCDTCGDPLFRYEGREFCPSCSQAEAGEPAVETSGDAAGATDDGEEAAAAGATDDGDRPGAVPQETVSPSTPRPADGQPAAGASRDVPDDVGGARAALARKLGSLASRAEATDDVARSRELLAAAREAAEALAAIDRIRE